MSLTAAHRCAPSAGQEHQTLAGSTSRGERLIGASTFCTRATSRRVLRVLADAEHVDGGLVDRVVLELDDDAQLIVRAHALPANGIVSSAVLLLEVADDPLNATAADAAALADAVTGATISRADVTGHTNTPTPYAVLLVLDNGRQVLIEAQAVPATTGSPLMTFSTVAGAAETSEHEALDSFDDGGRLVG